jgi:hypothetical protein
MISLPLPSWCVPAHVLPRLEVVKSLQLTCIIIFFFCLWDYLALYSRLASNLRFSCFSLPSVGITSVHNHAWLVFERVSLFFFFSFWLGLALSLHSPIPASQVAEILGVCQHCCFWNKISLCCSGWTWTCYIASAGLKLLVLLPQPPECWDYRHGPACPTVFLFFFLNLRKYHTHFFKS